jgi:hypothetical protein
MRFVVASALCLCGCTSLGIYDYHQMTGVTSGQDHVTVLQNGHKVGKTPLFLPLRRGRDPQLAFQYPSGDVVAIQPVEHYRWGASFGGNFFLTIYAPIGWAIDLATGTAYNFDNINRPDPSRPPKPGELVAENGPWVIAPPQASSEAVSRDIARDLERRLRRHYRRAHVLPVESFEQPFWQNHWRFDNEPGENDENELLAQMHVSYFVRSSVTTGPEQDHVTWQLLDAFTKEPVLHGEYDVDDDVVQSTRQRSWLERWNETFHLIPDLAAVDFGNSETRLQVDQAGPSTAHEDASPNFLGAAIRYIGALSLGVATPANTRGGWVVDFSFNPLLQFLSLNENFPDQPDISSLRFERSRASVGYGPRLGLNTMFGFFYGALIPQAGYNSLRAIGPEQSASAEKLALNLTGEIGWSRFLSSRLNLKLFVRSTTEDSDLWRQVIEHALGYGVNVSTVDYVTYGLSLGYYLPETKTWLH